MFYVYIINSITHPSKYYTGFTGNLSKRMGYHNNGQSAYTSEYKPWKLISYTAFSNKYQALKFEKYLKSGSGRAFASRHFRGV